MEDGRVADLGADDGSAIGKCASSSNEAAKVEQMVFLKYPYDTVRYMVRSFSRLQSSQEPYATEAPAVS